MKLIGWIVAGTFVGGVLGVWTAALLLLLPEKVWRHLQSYLVSFSVGTLLCVALVALLPETLEQVGIHGVKSLLEMVLAGIFVFFVLEKWVIWRHCHTVECETHGAHTPRSKSA